MSPDSLPHLSLGTAALVIFVVCAGFVMLRGLTRLIFGTLTLALSAWLGFLVWQKAPALSVSLLGKSTALVTTGLPILAFLVSFQLIRRITKAVASPFGKTSGSSLPASRSLPALAFRLLFTLLPTSVLWLIAATLVHHTGSIAEIRDYATKNPGIAESASGKFIRQLKSSVEAALPASWLDTLDPLGNPDRLALAKLVAAQSESKSKPVIDPKTGKPIPRAIVVDPELQNLAREGNFGTLLRHPLLTKALADPKVRTILKDLHL